MGTVLAIRSGARLKVEACLDCLNQRFLNCVPWNPVVPWRALKGSAKHSSPVLHPGRAVPLMFVFCFVFFVLTVRKIKHFGTSISYKFSVDCIYVYMYINRHCPKSFLSHSSRETSTWYSQHFSISSWYSRPLIPRSISNHACFLEIWGE